MIALACLAACLGFAPSPAGVSPRLNLASSRQRTRAAPAAAAAPPPFAAAAPFERVAEPLATAGATNARLFLWWLGGGEARQAVLAAGVPAGFVDGAMPKFLLPDYPECKYALAAGDASLVVGAAPAPPAGAALVDTWTVTGHAHGFPY